MSTIQANQRVYVPGREDLGVGEVLRITASGGIAQADVAFEDDVGRRLETFPVQRLQPAPDLFERLTHGDYDQPLDFLLKQLAYQFPLANTGGASQTAVPTCCRTKYSSRTMSWRHRGDGYSSPTRSA